MLVLDSQLESFGVQVHWVYYKGFFGKIKGWCSKMISYNHTRHSVFSLQVHLVFVVKRRGKAFNAERLIFLKDVFDGVCEEFESELVEFNGEEDHVHLLVSYPPKHSISSLVNSLKGVSSRVLKLQFPEIEHFWSVRKSRGALWSPSFFACSVGGAPLEILKQYIHQQALSPA